jgi:phosphoglycolate phosphatase-like HAD superfamily hydrolase
MTAGPTTYTAGMTPPAIEWLRPAPARPPRVAVFDFDGTLSLLREGWAGVMADIGLDLLAAVGQPADHAALEVEMLRLSGQPSITQMEKLAELAGAGDPPGLLADFHRRLFERVGSRVRELEAGGDPDRWAVPGSRRFLTDLQNRGVELVLLSGTDRPSVVRELALLKLDGFFGGRVFAPTGPGFTKRAVLESLGVTGPDLLGVGDGFAETVEVKRLGGFAVGVASREAGLPGGSPVKRRLLLDWGADVIVADYPAELAGRLCDRPPQEP